MPLDRHCLANEVVSSMTTAFEALNAAERRTFGYGRTFYPRLVSYVIQEAHPDERARLQRLFAVLDAATTAQFAFLTGGLVRLGCVNMPHALERK